MQSRFPQLYGKRICRSATVAFYIVAHLRRQVEFLREIGMEVFIVSSDGPEREQIPTRKGLTYQCIDIPRGIKPVNDLIALIRLYRFFRDKRFDIIHSTTPKAGLLSAIAGFLAGIRIRLHTWTGQQWVAMKGLKRLLSRMADRLIGFLNTRCYADSRSQMRFLIEEGIIESKKIAVIGENSLSGVDLDRFNIKRWTPQDRQEIRNRFSIPADAIVIIFVGRIAKDKGIFELITALKSLRQQRYEVELVLVGPFDQERGGDTTVSTEDLRNNAHIHLIGYTASPETFLSIADIFCLPSYREGFGTVVIEAASMGLPAVGTRINGLIDAIIDGETGILVSPGDEIALMKALKRLLDKPDELAKMGQNARDRCIQHFNADTINRALAAEYERLLTKTEAV